MLSMRRLLEKAQTAADRYWVTREIALLEEKFGGVRLKQDIWEAHLLGELARYEPNLRRYTRCAYERLWGLVGSDLGLGTAPLPKITLVLLPEGLVGVEEGPRDTFPEPAVLPHCAVILMGGTAENPAALAWRLTRGIALFTILRRADLSPHVYDYALLHGYALHVATRLYEELGGSRWNATLDVRGALGALPVWSLGDAASARLEAMASAVQTTLTNLLAIFLFYLRDSRRWDAWGRSWLIRSLQSLAPVPPEQCNPTPLGRPWDQIESAFADWLERQRQEP